MRHLLIVAAGLGLVQGSLGAELAPDRIYPEGSRFPLLLYSIHTVEEMNGVASAGWCVGHRYNFKPEFFDVVTEAGWLCVAHLSGKTTVQEPPKPVTPTAAKDAAAANREEAGETGEKVRSHERLRTEEELAADIRAYAANDCVAWWDFPEEQRFWRKDEYGIVKNLSAWTRKYDPRKRPNYMYLPGHYSAEGVAKYVEYLDIVGTGIYTEYSHQPRAWVRWRMEETIRGIREAGHAIGPDYLNGERVPIGIPMLFASLPKMDVITPVEAYHDFWSCIAAGAHGIFVFSYWHRRDLPVMQKTWDLGYNRAARNLTADPGLPQAILFGDTVELTVTVTKGSPRTCTFRPYSLEEDITLPAVNVLAKQHKGMLYVIAVSSQERPVTAAISGLPEGIDELELFGEERPPDTGGNRVRVENGAFSDSFPWLTVHLYRARLD